MATQVTIDDLANWLGITQRGGPVDDLLTRCLNATVEHIDGRLGDWVTDPWPANVEEAVLLQASRLYKRRSSPEGVAGFGDLGVVRVATLDPDVEVMLNHELALWFA